MFLAFMSCTNNYGAYRSGRYDYELLFNELCCSKIINQKGVLLLVTISGKEKTSLHLESTMRFVLG